jgi:hypothetical protein
MNATFKPVRKRALSSSTRMDLRFDDEIGGFESLSNFLGFFRTLGCRPSGSCNSKLLKELFGLIFVDVHKQGGGIRPPSERRRECQRRLQDMAWQEEPSTRKCSEREC